MNFAEGLGIWSELGRDWVEWDQIQMGNDRLIGDKSESEKKAILCLRRELVFGIFSVVEGEAENLTRNRRFNEKSKSLIAAKGDYTSHNNSDRHKIFVVQDLEITKFGRFTLIGYAIRLRD